MTTIENQEFVEGLQRSKDFSVIKISDHLEIEEIQNLFDTVPQDDFVPDRTRYKCIIRARVEDPRVVFSPDNDPLYQPASYNKDVYGSDSRSYPRMDERLAELLAPALRIFAGCAELGPEDEILGQAQRVTATGGHDARTGTTCREGWHTDGTSTLGILLVNGANVTGGISMLAYDGEGNDPVFTQLLEPGDLLIVDDRKLWHFSTPIRQVLQDLKAFRDIVILTYPACRKG